MPEDINFDDSCAIDTSGSGHPDAVSQQSLKNREARGKTITKGAVICGLVGLALTGIALAVKSAQNPRPGGKIL